MSSCSRSWNDCQANEPRVAITNHGRLKFFGDRTRPSLAGVGAGETVLLNEHEQEHEPEKGKTPKKPCVIFVRHMRVLRPVAIVDDGRERILHGSGDEARFRIRTRLMRRSKPIRERANLFGRLIARYRIWRFIERQMEKRAPRQGCYFAAVHSCNRTHDW